MKRVILLILVIFIVGCKNENQKTEEIKDQEIASEPVKEQEVKSDKLKGLFRIDMTQKDKSELRGRSLTVKETVTRNYANMNFTFYGNGIGVAFFDDGERKYLTKDKLSNNKFNYTIENDSIFMNDSDKEKFFFAVIKDESINQDYFVIDFEGDNEIKTRFGLYKVDDLPSNPLF